MRPKRGKWKPDFEDGDVSEDGSGEGEVGEGEAREARAGMGWVAEGGGADTGASAPQFSRSAGAAPPAAPAAAARSAAAPPSQLGGGRAPAPGALPGNIGAFEKHTKGFGAKMLAKFGFSGRLGKNEQGITQPIEVVVRPTQLGLGARGFREAAQLKVNKAVDRDLGRAVGSETADDLAGGERAEGGASPAEDLREGGAARPPPQRRAPRPPKQQYATAAALLSATDAALRGGGGEAGAGGEAAPSQWLGGGGRVLDLRGPVAREHASLTEAHATARGAGAAAPTRGGGADAELLRGLQALCDGFEAELVLAARRRITAAGMAARLTREAGALREEAAAAAAAAAAAREAHAAALAFVERVRSAAAPLQSRGGAEAGSPAPAAAYASLLHATAADAERLLERPSLAALPADAAARLRGAVAGALMLLLAGLPRQWRDPFGAEAAAFAPEGGASCAELPLPGAAAGVLGGLCAWARVGDRSRADAPGAGLSAQLRRAVGGALRAHLGAALSALAAAGVDPGGGAPPIHGALPLLSALAPVGAFAVDACDAFPASLAAAEAAGLPLCAPAGADARCARELLSLRCHAELLEGLVLPALLAAGGAWEPFAAACHVADWAVPWGAPHLLGGPSRGVDGTPLPGAAPPITALWVALRSRMEDTLGSAWHPLDPSAAEMLAPWSPPLWAPHEWAATLRRAVAPKLRALLAEVIVAGGGAGGGGGEPALAWLAPWLPLLPAALAEPLLEQTLPALWLEELAAALGVSPQRAQPAAVDFTAAAAWYEQWMGTLAPLLDGARGLRAGASGRLRARALPLLAAAVEAGESRCTWAAARARGGELLAPLRLAAARAETAAGGGAPPPPQQQQQQQRVAAARSALLASALQPHEERAVGASAAADVSFRDVLEALALERGLGFAPAPRRAPVDGCAVFKLGARAHAYVNSNVLFVDVGGGFKAVGLEEGLAAAAALE